MPGGPSLHHVAFRVADVERATRFYEQAFGATVVADSVVHDGEFAAMVTGGPPGVRFCVRSITIGDVGIELFEFLIPATATRAIHPSAGSLLHLALHVVGVPEVVAKVEAAGGRSLWPAPITWGSATSVYVADPDHNVLELLDASFADVVEMTIAACPEADPRGRGR
jgi:catechol 2,3-dioxygenase-like lactoylglutathione lyase family enzyme